MIPVFVAGSWLTPHNPMTDCFNPSAGTGRALLFLSSVILGRQTTPRQYNGKSGHEVTLLHRQPKPACQKNLMACKNT
ncbi:MAG: hypothetical protein QM800_06500 [Paludibacter sp.]